MIYKLAVDQQYRQLVRAIVAYLEEDPEQWEKDVEEAVRLSVPSKDIDEFRSKVLSRNPGMKSLSDYFDIVRPRNKDELVKMVKNTYEGFKTKQRPSIPTEVSKDPVTPVQDEIRQLEKENKALEHNNVPSEQLRQDIEKWRSSRPAISRTACLNVINSFLDSLE